MSEYEYYLELRSTRVRCLICWYQMVLECKNDNQNILYNIQNIKHTSPPPRKKKQPGNAHKPSKLHVG